MNSTLRSKAAASALSTLLLAAAGCPSSDGSCESSALCDTGTFCFEGRCVASLPASPLCALPGSTSVTAAPGVSSTATAADYAFCRRDVVATSVLPGSWIAYEGVNDVGARVSFSVPPGTSSVTIHSQAVSAADSFWYGSQQIPNSVVPTGVTLPNDHVLYDDMSIPPAQPLYLPAYYGGVTPWSGSFGVPNTSRLADLALANGEVPPGTWSFIVNDWNAECAAVNGCVEGSPGRYDVTVIARPGPYVSTGALDLNVYLVGGGAGLDAANAASYPGMARYLAEIGRLLGEAGICLRSVTFRDVPSWARSDTAFTQPAIDGDAPCGELSQLFTLAAPADGVHLFLVDAICNGGDCSSGIVGIDGSIPGPSGLPGAYSSGAAMTLDDIGRGNCGNPAPDLANCGSDRAGYIAAHEIGHWLGLYHTTEATGDMFDPLQDTGTCSCSACGSRTCDGAYGMPPQACMSGGATCAGGDNLMFWVIDPSVSIGHLTAQQSQVARLNPAVK
ncbi:MAG TPA: hypothetical protein VLT61_08290 [Anaeromyxobacteraceae bacterium]|nr:hypothetical protein [Anaeromyxobacteraceae bacterium]